MKKIISIPVLIFCMSVSLFGQAERKYIRQGNKEYKDEAFDKSEILYRRALEKDDKSYAGEFNLGDALYKQKKYEDAARSFDKMADNEKDPSKLSYLYHNMGNSYLQSKQLDKSIEAYKNALRNNPYDEETRYNLAYAQSLKQQQQKQDQNKDKQDQNKDKQDQNKDKQDQNKDKQDQNQNQDKQDQNQDKQEKQDQQQKQQQQQISREDAERMLQAMQQDEQDLQKKLQRQKASAQRVKVLKDW